MFGRFRKRSPGAGGIATGLYGAIVAQARAPGLYARLAVPDTVAGRFEMVVLHAALVLRRLRGEDDEARAVGQAVFDLFCADMDRSLRELGVGDLGVPKRMRKMAEAFYGRSAVYDEAIVADDPGALGAALRRNVFAGGEGPAAELASYVMAAVAALAAAPRAIILAGKLPFPDPAARAEEVPA